MSRLDWITDLDLERAVDILVKRAGDARTEAPKRIKKNVVDPFSSLVVASTFRIKTSAQLVNAQQASSALDGMGNALGSFHQQVLSSVDGWVNYDASYDLENEKLKILAEVKNKHNTMNSKTRKSVVHDLETALEIKRGWQAYLVIIIPRKPKRYKRQIHLSRPIFEIDGASFYESVTGQPTAIRDLFTATIDILNTNGHRVEPNVSRYCQNVFDTYIPPTI
ncbi:MAG: Eco47II family restriction endonuclease [Cenarchaeum sp. SB0662_bin_33]|nr:Eco47II family restriction endonuclease [Cenarchaeum sp. SB0662_bin_33]